MARANGKRRGFEFLCCAIPLINVGAYVTVVEIAIVALLVGVLALAPSYSIVAGLDVIPSWSKALVSALGFVTCLWQIVGIVSIRKEATKLYHAYVRITTLLTVAILAATIAFLVVAATSHDTAQSACNSTYGVLPASSSSGFTNSSIERNLGNDICNYFIWAQIGAMGGLILLIGLTQLYMCFALRAYGVAQRRATRDYKFMGAGALYDPTPEDSYPLAARNSTGRVDSPVWAEPQQNAYSTGPSAYGGQYADGRAGQYGDEGAPQGYAGQYGDGGAGGAPVNRYSLYDEAPGLLDQSAQGPDATHQPGYGAPAGYPTGGGDQYGEYGASAAPAAAPQHGAPASAPGGYETYSSR